MSRVSNQDAGAPRFNALLRRSIITGWTGAELIHRWPVLKLPGERRLYLHHVLGSDLGRAPHDHPKRFYIVGLWGGYEERVYDEDGNFTATHWRAPFIRRFAGEHTHRLILQPGQSAWTLVYTGPKYREWGFHDIELGWVHWRKYRDIVLGRSGR